MNDARLSEIAAWLTQAGLAGEPETAILTGFCARCVAAGVPIARALVLIDTLHPVYEGRLVRWGYDAGEAPLVDYGRTTPSRRKPRVDGGAARSIRCLKPARRCCTAG
jgi:adenylate cyclase